MRYSEFERVMSAPRMSRYLTACGGDTRKAMRLYRLNLKLTQELFTIISCLEVALRNAIDRHYRGLFGADWLRDSVQIGGIFGGANCRGSAEIIRKAYQRLRNRGQYTHSKLVADLDFGLWRYLFAGPQFIGGRQTLMMVFPAKPTNPPGVTHDHNYVFNTLLEKPNRIRNRMAHHEPICFAAGSTISTRYAREHYAMMVNCFQWLGIDESSLLVGLDKTLAVCNEIDLL